MGLLHALHLGVSGLVHGFVAAPGVVQELLLRRLKLPHFRHLTEGPTFTPLGSTSTEIYFLYINLYKDKLNLDQPPLRSTSCTLTFIKTN